MQDQNSYVRNMYFIIGSSIPATLGENNMLACVRSFL